MKKVGGYWLPDEDRYFKQFFMKGDGFQIERLQEAMKHVKHFRTAIDGGAHVGSWTRYMAGRFEKVYAFEPARETFFCLERNTEHLRNVQLEKAALGADYGMVAMTIDPKQWARGNTGSYYAELNKGDTPLIPLDSLGLYDVDLLKLDVEGAELLALEGARKTIEKCKPVVIMEIKAGYGARFGADDKAPLAFLQSMGARLVARIKADHILTF